MRKLKTVHERLWKKIDKIEERPDLCWNWIRKKPRKCYGTIRKDGRDIGAHRAVWEDVKGPIPSGLWVLHSCDNPECCNPNHLWLGTRQDNIDDMVKKGRQRRPPRVAFCWKGSRNMLGKFGDNHPTTKHPDEIVRKVLGEYIPWVVTSTDLASKYKVPLNTVRTWIKGSWRKNIHAEFHPR